MGSIRKLITAKDIRQAKELLAVPPNAIITPSARDLAESLGIQIVVQQPEAAPEDLASHIDHTNLAPDSTADDILRLCEEAVEYGFASVCVLPVRARVAAQCLNGTSVAVCGVVGFPTGGHDGDVKAQEARLCIQQGAREIDMVAHAGLLRDDNISVYYADICGVRSAIGTDTILKVIVEAPLLGSEELVRAAVIAAQAGADYVKTSTGVYAKAREDDVILLRRALPDAVKIKAAGGIRTVAQARKFLDSGADRIGTSASVEIVRELTR